MQPALKKLFEEQVCFKQEDGTAIDGSVYIGELEFIPVEILREDEAAYRTEFNRWLDEVWSRDQTRLRNRLLGLPGNAGRFSDLQQAIQREQVIPFIGSGMSAPSGYPTWSELLRQVRLHTTLEADELEDLLSSNKFEEAATALAANTTRRLFDERIEHGLRVGDPAGIQGPVSLLPGVPHRVVITTNLDDVLEFVFSESESSFDHVLSGVDLSRYRTLKDPRSRFLLKIHGDCRRPESRVLTAEEYESAYSSGGPPREELALLFRTSSLLFLGCSLGPDRTVRLIQEIARVDGHIPKHFAFLQAPEPDLERIQKEIFLTERGIFPIWYDGPHDECITALLAGLLTLNGTA